MENENIIELEALLKEKKEKKKKEANKQEQNRYYYALLELAKSEGFTDRVEHYLYEGIIYCCARPLKSYLDFVENKEECLEKFFNGKMYGNNADQTFRLLSNLFALLLNDKNSEHLVKLVVKKFAKACVNKDGKRLGTIEPIMIKNFFAELSPNVSFPLMPEINIKENGFINAMLKTLNTIEANDSMKNKVKNISHVKMWIDNLQQERLVTENHNNSNQKALIKATLVESSMKPRVEEVVKIVSNNVVDNKPVDKAIELLRLIEEANKVAIALKVDRAEKTRQVSELTIKLNDESNKLKNLEQSNQANLKYIEELQESLSAANKEIASLKETIAELNDVIDKKNKEIDERIRLADVIRRDTSKQSDEVLQRIASKLKVEYSDFLDARDVPMSCDLGENLRFQLQNVFDILEKGGIKIK